MSERSAHQRRDDADQDAAEATDVHLGAEDLYQDPPRAHHEGVQPARLDQGGEIGDPAEKEFAQIKIQRHQPKQEQQISARPLADALKAVDDHQDGHQLAAHHHQLRERLLEKGAGIGEAGSDQQPGGMCE